MNNQLYIPKTISVGQQKRSDTFTGKLAYIIYTDHKGVLRKETSWQGWRDKTIEPLTFNNDPEKGFTFNKGIKRDGHWGSGRSVIRVWDPRDFEFEISIDNLIGILMHADVSKRDITEPCVFAWKGTELILLPTNSLEYQESMKHTEKQGVKFSAKELVIGYTYNVRKENQQVVYLGRYDQYEHETVYPETNGRYRSHIGYKHTLKKTKKHTFYNLTTKSIEVKDPSAYISSVSIEEIDGNYAEYMDKYYGQIESQEISGVTVRQLDTPEDEALYHRYGPNEVWSKINETDFVQLYIHDTGNVEFRKFARWNSATQQLEFSVEPYKSGYSSYYSAQYDHDGRVIPGLNKGDPFVVVLIANLTQELQNNGIDLAVASTDYAVRYQNIRRIRINACRALNVGTLAHVLKDGKIALNHSM